MHGVPSGGVAAVADPQPCGAGAEGTNPDEIAIDDEDDADGGAVNVDAPVPETKTENAPPRANPDEITLDDEEDEVEAPPLPPPPPTITNFLALDKCLPKRQFLEVRIFPCFSLPSV